MAKTFTFPIPTGRDAADILAKAKDAGRSRGIVFTGDATSGRFQGPAEGTYAVADRVLTISVDKKPALVPWMMIESALKDLFGRG